MSSPLDGLGIKGAIRAFLRAKRDVDIKAGDARRRWIRHEDRITTSLHRWRTKMLAAAKNWMSDSAVALRYACTRWTFWAFNPFSLGTTSKETSSPSLRVLNPVPDNGRMMHKHILPGTLGDEPEPFFIVEPLDFAAGHNDS